MGSQAVELEDAEVLSFTDGDRFNEWTIEHQIVAPGYMGRNRAWQAHCTFCRWQRVLHEATISSGFVPRCINNCGE